MVRFLFCFRIIIYIVYDKSSINIFSTMFVHSKIEFSLIANSFRFEKTGFREICQHLILIEKRTLVFGSQLKVDF